MSQAQTPPFKTAAIGFCPTQTRESEVCYQQLKARLAGGFRAECPACGTVWEGADGWRRFRDAQTGVRDLEVRTIARAIGHNVESP